MTGPRAGCGLECPGWPDPRGMREHVPCHTECTSWCSCALTRMKWHAGGSIGFEQQGGVAQIDGPEPRRAGLAVTRSGQVPGRPSTRARLHWLGHCRATCPAAARWGLQPAQALWSDLTGSLEVAACYNSLSDLPGAQEQIALAGPHRQHCMRRLGAWSPTGVLRLE